jgi:6-phosphogluconolactonase
MAYIATDRSGRYLLAAAYDAALVSSSSIDASGAVGSVIDVFATAPGAHAIQADLHNARVLYTSLDGDVVYQRELDAETGELRDLHARIVKLPSGAGPRHFTFSRDGTRVFVLGERDASIHVYRYDRSAGLTPSFAHATSALPDGFVGKPWAADIHLTPDGRFLFASERTSSSLTAFRVDPSNGNLARVGSYVTAAQPRAFAIDPSGRLLLAVGERSHTLRVHAIDVATGALTLLGEHAVGQRPNWVEIVHLGDVEACVTAPTERGSGPSQDKT